MYYRKISGDKVYLSPIRLEDYAIYTKWLNDSEVTMGLGNHPSIISEAQEKEWLEKLASATDQVNLAIIDAKTDQVIGNCGLMDISPVHRKAMIGIFIGEAAYRNGGYGTEAMALLLDFGFRVLNLHNIHLKYFSFNARGEKAYRKLGFKEVGRRRESVYYNGQYYDDVEMDILEDEFRQGPYAGVAQLELEGYQF